MLIFGLIISGVLIQIGIQTNSALENGFSCYIGSATVTPNSANASTTGPPTMAVSTGSSYLYLGTGLNQTAGEKATGTTSALYQLPVTGETVKLAKIGSPNGNITFGVFDNTGATIKTFGTVNASTLTGSDTSYTKSNTEYDLNTNDRVGIKYVPVNGTTNYEIQFNGTSYAQAANSTVFSPGTGNYSFWGDIFRRVDTGAAEELVRKKATFSGADAGYHLLITGGDVLQLLHSDGSGAAISLQLTGSTIQVNHHYMFGVGANRAGSATIYLYDYSTGLLKSNSISIASQAGSMANAQIFTIARNSGGSDSFFKGDMNNLNVKMGGNAISQADFLNLINDPTSVTPTSRYKFDQNGNDSVGGNPLTLFAGPTYVKTTIGDNVRVLYNNANPYDGTTSILSGSFTGTTWNDVSGSDLANTLTVTSAPASNTLDGSTSSYWANGNLNEVGANIYFDMGTSTSINQVKINHPSSVFIPATVQVFVSNNPSSWGTAKGTFSLSQSTGQQTLSLSTDTSVVGRYVMINATSLGTAKYWRLSDVTTTAANTSGSAYQACTNVRANVWLILNIASYGLIFAGLFIIFQPVIGRFSDNLS